LICVNVKRCAFLKLTLMLTTPCREPNIFRLQALHSRDADRALPLVQLYEPSLTRSAWRSYVREQSRGEGGVMCLEDPRGYIHGMFAWSVRRPLVERRIMAIRDLILLQLPGKALQEAVMDAIADFARAKSCQSLVMGVEEVRPSVKGDVLMAHGFRPIGEKTFEVELEPA
jgi:hypothetical protein